MAQFVRPSADLVTNAQWTATPYWSKIDDAGDAGADSTYINNASPETTDIIAVDGTTVTDPASSTGHVIRARFEKVAGGGTLRLTVQLRQGYVDEGTQGTLIATGVFDEADAAVFATYTSTLSGTEADSITDYTDLQFRIWAARDTGTVGREINVEYVEFEVPDAGGAQQDLTGSTFQKAPTFPQGAVAATYDLTGTVFQKAPTFPTGAVAPGAVTVTGSTFQKAPSFPTGAVSAGGAQQDLTGSTFQKAPTFPQGLVEAGSVTVSGSTFQKAPTFPQGAVTVGEVTLVGTVFQKAPTFPTGAVAAGSVTVTGTVFVSAPVFPTGVISGVTEHSPGPATAPLGGTGSSTIDTAAIRLAAELVTTGTSDTTVSTGISTAPIGDSSSEAE